MAVGNLKTEGDLRRWHDRMSPARVGGSGSNNGGLVDRGTVTASFGLVGAGLSAFTSVPVRGARLVSVLAFAPGRVRVYGDAVEQMVDEPRGFGSTGPGGDPNPNHCLLDVRVPGMVDVPLAPAPDCHNTDGADVLYVTFTDEGNMGGYREVTFTVLVTEAV